MRRVQSTTPSICRSAGTASRFPTGSTSCTAWALSSSVRSAVTSATRAGGVKSSLLVLLLVAVAAVSFVCLEDNPVLCVYPGTPVIARMQASKRYV